MKIHIPKKMVNTEQNPNSKFLETLMKINNANNQQHIENIIPADDFKLIFDTTLINNRK